MQIRTARPDELATVGRVTVEAYVSDGLLSAADSGYVAELADAGRRAAEAELLVAVDGSDVLGTVTFCVPPSPWAEVSSAGEAEFRMLAVASSARGRGVGRALAQECVQRARDRGCRAVVLSTLPQMASAHRIYERMGFVRAPERDWRPEPTVPLLVYVLGLTPAG